VQQRRRRREHAERVRGGKIVRGGWAQGRSTRAIVVVVVVVVPGAGRETKRGDGGAEFVRPQRASSRVRGGVSQHPSRVRARELLSDPEFPQHPRVLRERRRKLVRERRERGVRAKKHAARRLRGDAAADGYERRASQRRDVPGLERVEVPRELLDRDGDDLRGPLARARRPPRRERRGAAAVARGRAQREQVLDDDGDARPGFHA
jgi:hypothetical protein